MESTGKTDQVPASSPKTPNRQCAVCKAFLLKSDSHTSCPVCRPCTLAAPCPIDKSWSEDDWAAFSILRDVRVKARAAAHDKKRREGKKAGSGAGKSNTSRKIGKAKSAPSPPSAVGGGGDGVISGPVVEGLSPNPNPSHSSPNILSGWAAVGHAPPAEPSIHVGSDKTPAGLVLARYGLSGMGMVPSMGSGGEPSRHPPGVASEDRRFSERARLSHVPLTTGTSRRISTAPAALGRPPVSDDEPGGSESTAVVPIGGLRAPKPSGVQLVETAGVVVDEPEGSIPHLGGGTGAGFEDAIRQAVLASFSDPRVREAMLASSAYGSEPQRGSKRSFEESEDGGSQGPFNPAEAYEEADEEEWECGEDPYVEYDDEYVEYDEYEGPEPGGSEMGEVDEGAALMGPPHAFPPAGPRGRPPIDESVTGSASCRSFSSSVGSWVALESIPRSPVDYLEPARAGPFIAKVLADAGQPVSLDPVAPPQPPLGDLGFMNPASFQRKPTRHVPVVPLSETVRALVRGVEASAVAHEAATRDPLVTKLAPFRTVDEDIFVTPKCPESCFLQMEADQRSKCIPVQPVPAGVEGDSTRKKAAPFQVESWNRASDSDLRRMEDLARDGLRIANLQSFVMAHTLRALTDDSVSMDQEERVQSLETLKELQHMSTRHFAAIAAQSVITRRTCAIRALNFPDRRALMHAQFGSSLFGDEWETILQGELHRRRFAAEARFMRGRRGGSESRPGNSQARPRAGQPTGRPAVRGGRNARSRGRGGRVAQAVTAAAGALQAQFPAVMGVEETGAALLPPGSFLPAPPPGGYRREGGAARGSFRGRGRGGRGGGRGGRGGRSGRDRSYRGRGQRGRGTSRGGPQSHA